MSMENIIKKSKIIIIFLAIIIIACDEPSVSANEDLSTSETARAIVVRVTDGDTVVVRLEDNSQHSVRIIGVNAPEATSRVEPFGPEATAFLRRLLPEETRVWLTREGSNMSYSRLRRHIWLDYPSADGDEAGIRRNSVGARILLAGYGEVLPNFTPKYRVLFQRFQEEAQNQKRGMWK